MFRFIQCCKPHLPVQPGLVRLCPSWHAAQVSGFIFELIVAPGLPVVGALNSDLRTRGRHVRKQAIRVNHTERLHPPHQRDSGIGHATGECPHHLEHTHVKDECRQQRQDPISQWQTPFVRWCNSEQARDPSRQPAANGGVIQQKNA